MGMDVGIPAMGLQMLVGVSDSEPLPHVSHRHMTPQARHNGTVVTWGLSSSGWD